MARSWKPVVPLVLAVLLLAGCGADSASQSVNAGPDALQWSFVDGDMQFQGLSAGSQVRMAELNGRLYLTYTEGNHIRAAVYGGSDAAPVWNSVTGAVGGLEKDPVDGTARNPNLIVFNGKLYAVWTEGGALVQDCVRVAVYNGNDAVPSWSFVDGGGATTAMLGDSAVRGPSPAVLGTKLYVAWENGVAVYNGNDAAPAWSMVDAGAVNGAVPQLAVLNSKLYVAYSDTVAVGIAVKVYNGNDGAPAWAAVHGPFASRGAGNISRGVNASCNYPSLAVFDGRLYLSWSEDLNLYLPLNIMSEQIHVAVYSGDDASPDWSFLDGGGSFGINKDYTSYSWYGSRLTAANGKLYAIWSEEYPLTAVGQIRVAVFNGNPASPCWSFVDGNKATGLNRDAVVYAEDPFLVAFGGKLYAGWNENGQVRVAVGK